jgi:hypothetical protein
MRMTGAGLSEADEIIAIQCGRASKKDEPVIEGTTNATCAPRQELGRSARKVSWPAVSQRAAITAPYSGRLKDFGVEASCPIVGRGRVPKMV